MSQKILEIKPEDWMKGISTHPTYAQGGLFRTASNFDPFARQGLLNPTNAPTTISGTSVAIKWLTPYFNSSGLMYGYGDATLYSIDPVGNTATDVSAQTPSISGQTARGSIVYAGKFLYAINTAIYQNAIPVASGSEASLVTGLTSGEHPLTLGADLACYFPNGNSIGRIVDSSGTLSAVASVFSLETSMTIRHLVNDGRYLIIIADSGSTGTSSRTRCVVAYWDYTSPNLSQRYDFESGSLIGGIKLEDTIYIFGYEGLFVTNVVSSPRFLLKFDSSSDFSNAYPNSVGTLTLKGNAFLWASSQTIYQYGSYKTGQTKIFSTINSVNSGTITALNVPSGVVWGSTSSSAALYKFTSSTANTLLLRTAKISLDRPYKFDFLKVILEQPFLTGNNLEATITTGGVAYQVLDTTTRSFTTDGARQVLIFKPLAAIVPPPGNTFLDINYLQLTSGGGTVVLRAEIWGTPTDSMAEIL